MQTPLSYLVPARLSRGGGQNTHTMRQKTLPLAPITEPQPRLFDPDRVEALEENAVRETVRRIRKRLRRVSAQAEAREKEGIETPWWFE